MSDEDLRALDQVRPAFERTASSTSEELAWTRWAEAMALAPEGYELAASRPRVDELDAAA
jgi:hypothetical protein